MSSPAATPPVGVTMGRMISRSDVSSTAPLGLPPDGERDLLAINGHHFELGGAVAPLGVELA